MAHLEHTSTSPDAESMRRAPDILACLEKAVGQIQDSDNFRAYLDIQSRFHRYSPNNALLILLQRPDATQVAGYNAWLKMHRYVKRGEKAIKIIVPMTKKVPTEMVKRNTSLYLAQAMSLIILKLMENH